MNKLKNIMLILISCLMLVACGSSEYDQAIDDVIKLENTWLKNEKNDKYTNQIEKNKINFYVYEKGNVIVLEYPLEKNDNDYLVTQFYTKNLTTGKYQSSSNFATERHIFEEDYMKQNEPDYKEINIK